jgi:hypothetical protein
MSVLIGNGDGTFQDFKECRAGAHPSAVTLGDVDGDSLLDAVVSNATSSTVSYYHNLGDGVFSGRMDYSVGEEPSAVSLVDLNGDGFPEILTGNRRDSSISVLWNIGSSD